MAWKDYETLDVSREEATDEEIQKLKEKYGLSSEEDENTKN